MPSACFDAIRNVSTLWKHAKGMSLRYGAVIFGDLTLHQFSIRRWRAKKSQPAPWWCRLADLFRDDDYLLKITLGNYCALVCEK